jgi:O-antigen/teichoic acid export membrane protein
MPRLTTVARNLLALVAGEISGRLLTFVGTVYLARTLGSRGFGIASFAAAIVTYFSFAVHFGLDQVGSREVARNPRARSAYAAQVVALRSFLAVVAYALLALLVFAVPGTGIVRRVVLLHGLVLFALAGNLGWAFQGLERMGAYAVATSLGHFVFVAAALDLVTGPAALARVPLCYVAGEATVTVLLLVQFGRRFGLSALPLDRTTWRASLGAGFPFFATRFARTMGIGFDVLALKLYLGDAAVGLYSAASRIALFVLGVGVLYFVSVSPALARAAKAEPGRIPALLGRSLRLTAIAAVPLGIGGAIVAPGIVTMLFGAEYAAAGTPLRLLLLAVAVSLVGQNYRVVLVASDRQRADMRIVSASAVLAVTLNLLLVPWLGLSGAAGAFLGGEVLLLALALPAARPFLVVREGLHHLLRPLGASIAMAAPLLAMRSMPVITRIAAGALAYGAAILALRGTTVMELRDLLVARRHGPTAPGPG